MFYILQNRPGHEILRKTQELDYRRPKTHDIIIYSSMKMFIWTIDNILTILNFRDLLIYYGYVNEYPCFQGMHTLKEHLLSNGSEKNGKMCVWQREGRRP